MELFANVRNPANWKQYNNLTLGEFKGRGLDGASLSKNDEAKTFDGFVISQPTQIKSAIGNAGAFDAKDAHINKAWPFPPSVRILFFKAA